MLLQAESWINKKFKLNKDEPYCIKNVLDALYKNLDDIQKNGPKCSPTDSKKQSMETVYAAEMLLTALANCLRRDDTSICEDAAVLQKAVEVMIKSDYLKRYHNAVYNGKVTDTLLWLQCGSLRFSSALNNIENVTVASKDKESDTQSNTRKIVLKRITLNAKQQEYYNIVLDKEKKCGAWRFYYLTRRMLTKYTDFVERDILNLDTDTNVFFLYDNFKKSDI